MKQFFFSYREKYEYKGNAFHISNTIDDCNVDASAAARQQYFQQHALLKCVQVIHSLPNNAQESIKNKVFKVQPFGYMPSECLFVLFLLTHAEACVHFLTRHQTSVKYLQRIVGWNFVQVYHLAIQSDCHVFCAYIIQHVLER